MAPALSCREGEELLTLAALGVLTRGDGSRLDEHLAGCAACRSAARHYQDASVMLLDALEPAIAPPSVRRSLMRTVYAESAPAERPQRRTFLRVMTSRRTLSLA